MESLMATATPRLPRARARGKFHPKSFEYELGTAIKFAVDTFAALPPKAWGRYSWEIVKLSLLHKLEKRGFDKFEWAALERAEKKLSRSLRESRKAKRRAR
jgi:hypothetical protein